MVLAHERTRQADPPYRGRMESVGTGGLVLDVVAGGPPDGAVVLLLHGFPQDATAWDETAARLHAAGLRTLAPHQRGYSPRAAPRRVSAYALPALVDDALAVLDAAGAHRAHVVGHDWGGAVAWALAQRHPDRVSGLVVLSTPHPAALRAALGRGDQARRSWYVLAMQLPLLPEVVLAGVLRRGGLRRSGLPAAHGRRYAARLGRARDLRGPVHWYRAAVRSALRQAVVRSRRGEDGADAEGTVEVPTTFVWGARDPFLGRAAAEGTARHVRGDYRFVEVAAGHWLPEREPALVAAEVLARVSSPTG